MNEVPDWLVELRTAERDEEGLTRGQREGADIEVESVLLDWRPRILYMAKQLGVGELEAIGYSRLVMEYRRMMSTERHTAAYIASLDTPEKESQRKFMALCSRYIEREIAEDEDWNP